MVATIIGGGSSWLVLKPAEIREDKFFVTIKRYLQVQWRKELED